MFGEPMDLWMLAYSFIFAIVSIIVGGIIFDKNEDKFILHI